MSEDNDFSNITQNEQLMLEGLFTEIDNTDTMPLINENTDVELIPLNTSVIHYYYNTKTL